MALRKAALAVTFAGGLDTKTDAKHVAIMQLLDLQNAVFTKNGTLSKRTGYRALGEGIDGTAFTYGKPILRNPVIIAGGFAPPPSLSGGGSGGGSQFFQNGQVAGLGKRGDELLLFANGHSYSYRDVSDSWNDIGPTSSVIATQDPMARTGTAQTAQDMADNSGVTAVAWEDSRGGVWCSAIQTTGGRVLLAPVQLDAAATSPRCCAVGAMLHVYYLVGARIWVAVIDPLVPETTPVPVILTEDLTGSSYDAMATLGSLYASGPALLAWRIATGFRVGYVHPSGVLGSPVTGLPAVATYAATVTGPIAVALAQGTWTTGYAAVLWASSDLNYRILIAQNPSDGTQASGILSAGPVTWNRIACAFGDPDSFSGNSVIWWAGEVNGASADKNTIRSGSLDSFGAIAANVTLRGHALASRAFYDAGDVSCCVVHPVLYFPYVATVRLSGALATHARLLPGLSSGIPTRSALPSAFPVSPNGTQTSRRHGIALGYRIQLGGTSGTQFGEAGILRNVLDFDHDDAFRSTELGRGLYLSGALLQHYDGRRWAEADFHCAPDTATGVITTAKAGGGNLTASSTYVYKYLYEEIDAQGELHPGAVSIGTTVTLGVGETKVTHTLPTCRLTNKTRVRIGVFRSLAGATGDPESIPYYRVSSVDPTAAGNNGYVANDTTVDTVSFVDAMSDAILATLEPLYTNGGVLSNDPAPSGGEIIAGGKSRLFWTDPMDGSLVRFSQELREDTAAELSAGLTVRVDPFGGDIVALAVMDDNVIVLKEHAIFAFGGIGPLADGGLSSQGSFSPPQLVTSDVGCSSRSSVAQMPLGIVFQSDKGIYMLGRDLQVKRIGDPVYAFKAQRVSRSTLITDRPHVVFLTDQSDGFSLMYDYDRNQWSKFSNHQGFDAISVAGVYHYLRLDGRLFVENEASYADDNAQIPMIIETAWVKMAGYLQGWQKILHALILGTWKSKHQLRVRYRLDYEDAYSAPFDLPVNGNYNPLNYGTGNYGAGNYDPGAGISSIVYQERIHLNRRCQSISFRFEDIQAASDRGASFELSELLLTGGVVGPAFQPGANRQG